MKFNQLPNITSKDDKWRFSPRARLSHSTFDRLSETDIESLEYNELNGLFKLLDQTILEHPKFLTNLPNLTGPKLGSEDTFLLASSFLNQDLFLI